MHHPWRAFRLLTDWILKWELLPGDLLGYTDHASRTIVLDRRLTQAERRCTIAHELEHQARGPVPAEPVLAAREEAAVDAAVARKLIPIRKLGEALAWSQDPDEVAEELWVDVQTLEVRLRRLHPSERHYLRRCLAAKEEPC